jgi:hypothetical protein
MLDFDKTYMHPSLKIREYNEIGETYTSSAKQGTMLANI